MEIVNGYRCESCKDVALAKRGIDPAQGELSPVEREQQRAQRQGLPFDPGPAALGVNQPLTDGARGTRLNILV